MYNVIYTKLHTCFDIAAIFRSHCIHPRNVLMQIVVFYQNKCVVLYIYQAHSGTYRQQSWLYSSNRFTSSPCCNIL